MKKKKLINRIKELERDLKYQNHEIEKLNIENEKLKDKVKALKDLSIHIANEPDKMERAMLLFPIYF